MKRNVLLIVVLGLALYGVVAGLGHWASSENDALGYSTERMVEAAYRAPAHTAYTPPAAGNSAVAVPMSAAQGSPFRHTYVPVANYTFSTPMLSGGSYAAQGLTLTSQPRQQSYGGGGSAMGASSSTRMGMGSGSTSGSSYAMGGYASSGYASSSTYTYSTSAGGGISVNGNMTSTFPPSAVYASAPAPYASFNNDFGILGNAYNPLDGSVSTIDDQTPFGGILASAQRRAAGNIQQTWYNWLKNYVQGDSGNWSYEDGTYYFTEEQIRAAYEAWLAAETTGGMATAYTYEQWRDWFMGQSSAYKYRSPVGDVYPLVVMALCLTLYIAFRRKRSSRAV